jgi:uncharacterized membrane protein YqjE
MSDQPNPEGGLFETVPRLWRTVRQVATSRVELFLVEWKEERLRLFDTLLLVAAATVCAAMAAVLLALTLVVMFWQEHRVAVLGLLTVLFASGAGALVWTVRRRLLHWQAFAATREQLKKDCACFGTGN